MGEIICHPNHSPRSSGWSSHCRNAGGLRGNPTQDRSGTALHDAPPVPGRMETVPAYVVAMRNTAGAVFVLPDFVKHDGLPKGSGFQNFPTTSTTFSKTTCART